QKAGELDLERSSSPELSSKKQNKLDKNRPDYKNSTYFVNGLRLFLKRAFHNGVNNDKQERRTCKIRRRS
ncbi:MULTISPECIES: hypothetical protein, partial [Bacillus]